MEPRYLLLAYVLMIHTLTSGMWWIAGRWMGLSRRAAGDWFLSSLGFGLSLVLLILDAGERQALGLMLASCLGVFGVASLRRGLQCFLRLPVAPHQHRISTLVPVVFNLGLCLPMGWTTLGVVLSCLWCTVLLACCGREIFGPLVTEFHKGTAIAAGLLLTIGAAIFVSMAMSSLLLDTHPDGFLPVALRQFLTAFVSAAMSITLSFLLGYIVVMRLVYRLQHLSQHDSLTGLLNRRAIEQALAREAQRLQRFGEPYSVLLVDIDHFKRINDQQGHAAGDEVLRAVAHVLKLQAREVDRISRFGGEEFCVLLPHTDHEGALQAAERLRCAIQQNSVAWQNDTIAVTISTGVATATDPEEPMDRLLRRADAALYQAKSEGRNRVAVSPRLHLA